MHFYTTNWKQDKYNTNAQCTLTPQIGSDKHKHKHQGNNGKCLVVGIAFW